MDVEGLPGASTTGRLWRAYVPTSLVWQAAVPLLTNALGNPLAQTGMETQYWHSVPFPLELPSAGPVVYTNRSSVGAIFSMTAMTNSVGSINVYHGNTRASNYLAVATVSTGNYLAGGPFTFGMMEGGIVGTVSFARDLPPATTNLTGLVAQEAWVNALVAGEIYTLSEEIYTGLWTPFEEHTNNLANPHGVTAAQIGALTNETDAAALGALAEYAATNRVTRLWGDDTEWINIIDGTTMLWRVTATTNEGYRITDGYDMDPYTDNQFFAFVSDLTVTNATVVTRTILYGDTSTVYHLQWQRVGNTGGTWNNNGWWLLYRPGSFNSFEGEYLWPTGGKLETGYLDDSYVTIAADSDEVITTNSVALATGLQLAEAVAPLATTNFVTDAIAAIPETDLTGKLDVTGGTATNLATAGWLALPQTQNTNLTYRLVVSNDVILAIGVWE